MMIQGRTFSAVLYGRLEIHALHAKGQMAIQMPGGNSIITDNQILECESVWADRGAYTFPSVTAEAN